MPEQNEGKPKDGDEGEGKPPEGGAPAGGTQPPPPEKTFTQAEMNAIIQERLARDKVDPEILRKAKAFDAAEEANKTELQKEKDRADRAEAKTAEAEARADATLVRAAIMAEAASQDAIDAATVAQLLAGVESVTVVDNEVKGAAAAVKKLLTDRPFLVKGKTPGTSGGGEFGGKDKSTLDEQIRAAEEKGDWTLSRQKAQR